MTRKSESQPLDTGDTFPALSLKLTDGKSLTIPDQLATPFTVVLVNRGSWCPFCIGQLKAFQGGLPKLQELGVGVVSLSADSLDQARAVVDSNALTFPVAYGIDVERVATALGCFYDPTPTHTTPYLHATGFVLGPDHKIITAVYSSGAIGRLVVADVLGLVQYIKSSAH